MIIVLMDFIQIPILVNPALALVWLVLQLPAVRNAQPENSKTLQMEAAWMLVQMDIMELQVFAKIVYNIVQYVQAEQLVRSAKHPPKVFRKQLMIMEFVNHLVHRISFQNKMLKKLNLYVLRVLKHAPVGVWMLRLVQDVLMVQ